MCFIATRGSRYKKAILNLVILVCANDDVSNHAELRKRDNAVIGFKKDVSESPAFIDQHM